MELAALTGMADRAAAYVELANAYANGTEAERAAIISGWDFGVAWKYPNPKRLACATGERYTPHERIRASLLYAAIASARRLVCDSETTAEEIDRAKAEGQTLVDYRDELVALAIDYNSSTAAGFDADETVLEVAHISPPPVRHFLERFVHREHGLKSMNAFLLAAVTNGDGEIEIHQRPWSH